MGLRVRFLNRIDVFVSSFFLFVSLFFIVNCYFNWEILEINNL